ncbi:hypothetical protein PV327_010224 [Microctonus hyperodae]|uniref:Ubiquitin conjugation factor E4 A n=1 Tax=Microctonus hyperodae TaxID=165561 RepID=A0AA39FRG1_MICHY|nr:hypothetical protein PV327_010224 [Microctonus hyperodae]
MGENLNNNPFAGLFSTPNDAASYSNESMNNDAIDNNTTIEDEEFSRNGVDDESPNNTELNNDKMADNLVQEIFGLLLNTKTPMIHKQLIAVDCDTIEDALFERLSMEDIESHLVPPVGTKGITYESHVMQSEIIPYLFNCYCRLEELKEQKKYRKVIDQLLYVIHCSMGTALEAPEVFPHQEVHLQFFELFMDTGLIPEVSAFVDSVASTIIAENPTNSDDVLLKCFEPLLKIVHHQTSNASIMTFHRYWIDILQVFANIEPLARVLIRICTPDKGLDSLAYTNAFMNNILGSIISTSCLPRPFASSFEFFDSTTHFDGRLDGEIGIAQDNICDNLYKVFHSLLKCSPEIRDMTLRWLGQCLEANSLRGQLSNGHFRNGAAYIGNDGFMINLCSILLRLCQPFCTRNHEKIPKIDPTYCAAEIKDEADRQLRGVHIAGLHKETCLIPTSSNETRPVAKNFGFITECFYLTHRALDLGFRVVLDKLMKSNQDLNRIQRLLNDASESGNSDVIDAIRQRLQMEMSKYLSMRACLLSPELLNLLSKFHSTSAFWLMQVYVDEPNISDDIQSYCPLNLKSITFPMSDNVPQTLRCIPEFVVENTVGFVCFLRRFHPNTFEEHGAAFLNPILTEIIVLMESPKRLFNPHLRAQLAEALESLLPTCEDPSGVSKATLGTFHREQLFVTHPYRHQIAKSLLEVFVGIEMSGQNVQFEQKFNYRRPMYIVMNYLWKFEEHQNHFKLLAQDAEANMEAVQPPLFLRFINLLMNDAVFLLDEAFSNMAQLKQLLNAKENGEWNNLSSHERSLQFDYLQQIGMMARFDNILGRETISTIKMLTSEIKSIFCHPTMVDRIASMLNYLLLQLTGPKNRTLKVKHQQDYEFNPANLVLNICEIYINLAKNDNFTLAVSQDGRSYKPELFQLADNVLVRIGGVGILNDLDVFSKRVAAAARMKRKEDEILTGAPDEFLDPIMMTLMTDPVILPSSKVTVDRQTIARHLLSDQIDPFNRSPLTMDMVKSDVELQKKIQDWILTKKKENQSTE